MPDSVRGKILVVDDDSSLRELLEDDLARRGHEVSSAPGMGKALELIQGGDFDVVLTDLNMPGNSGIDLCNALQERRPDLPVVILTAFGSLDTAIAALRAGAYDFVTKPVDLDLLALTLLRALKHHQMQETLRQLQDEVRRSRGSDLLLGDSQPMLRLKEMIARIAAIDSSVLITGESGTGKELVARSLHEQSGRCNQPFVAVNCAALPGNLLESELFGHEKGAFTDARLARKGLFLEASGGTLLLDEVGELPLALQPKLLRVLEERRVRPLGGQREIPCDVRLVAATHRDLGEAVEIGEFREDLFYRLNVITLDLPTLRARGNDILLLAQTFLDEFAKRFNKAVHGMTETTAHRLLNYSWPGNVRELRNAIERGVALTRHSRLVPEDLPDRLQHVSESGPMPAPLESPSSLLPLAEMEQRYIQHVLDAVAGNRSLAAKILGVDRKTLYRKLKES